MVYYPHEVFVTIGFPCLLDQVMFSAFYIKIHR
uniref:Uncharacterized protein n=1 Tax=Rhizophora mucronata TaxID=61149 RepID=A0A2P2QJU5_RHIMU